MKQFVIDFLHRLIDVSVHPAISRFICQWAFGGIIYCLGMIVPCAAADSDSDATITFAARPPIVSSEGHSTTISGHAFIIIGIKTNFGPREETFGFYPVNNSLKGMIKGPGMLKAEQRCGPNDDCSPKHKLELGQRLSEVTDSVTVPATLGDVRKVYQVIKEWDSKSYVQGDVQVVPSSSKDYALIDRNCIDFIATVASRLGYPLPGRSELELPVEYLRAMKPMVEQELQVRSAKLKAQESEAKAKESAARADQAESERDDAVEKRDRAQEKAKAAEAKAAAAEAKAKQIEANTVPAGWVRCNCPAVHAALGKVVNGVRYHPDDGNMCPN